MSQVAALQERVFALEVNAFAHRELVHVSVPNLSLLCLRY